MPTGSTRTTTRHPGVYAVTGARGTRYVATWRDADGRQREKVFQRMGDAVAHRAAAMTDQARGVDEARARVAEGRRTTVRDVAEAWYAAGAAWRPSTSKAHRSILDRHVLPWFGHRPVAQVRPSDVRRWVAEQRAAGASPSTITSRRNVLRAVMATAVDDRLITTNPAANVKVPKDPRTPADRAAALTAQQLGAVVAALPGRLQPYALALAWTGMRPSEAAGLTVDRVDFLRRTITVDRQLVARTGQVPVFGPVKTAASVRVLPLPDQLADVLAAHLAEHGPGPDGLIFTTSRSGGPFVRGVRAEAWARAVRGVELPPAVRGWHALRHTYASTLLAEGTDLATVSRLMGHASIAETAQTYAHALPGRDDAARNVAAAALSTVVPARA